MSSLAAAQRFLDDVARFQERVRQLGLPDVSRYYWYHTIDLGDGLITPGLYDYRATVSCFGFPEDMRGMTVLDIGSATGFFAFEFERRGAHVVSVELPGLEHLDRFPGQRLDNQLRIIERMIFPDDIDLLRPRARGDSARELYWYLLEGPFRFCATRLNSRVERRYCTIYELAPEKVGRQSFDLVFLGDVLVHTLYPLRGLAAAAALCHGTLILAQTMPEQPAEPAMTYVGGEDPDRDDISWWLPNKACFRQLLKKLRFRQVIEHGVHRGLLRPSGYPFERVILHAVR
jgi:tRNA (mo5U34)-methyltransferase